LRKKKKRKQTNPRPKPRGSKGPEILPQQKDLSTGGGVKATKKKKKMPIKEMVRARACTKKPPRRCKINSGNPPQADRRRPQTGPEHNNKGERKSLVGGGFPRSAFQGKWRVSTFSLSDWTVVSRGHDPWVANLSKGPREKLAGLQAENPGWEEGFFFGGREWFGELLGNS